MRFCAQFPNFQIKLRDPETRVTAYGIEPVRDGIVAEFDSNGWNQRDYETAMRAFQMKGFFQFEDEATPVPPTYRVSVYDTELEQQKHGWDDELREDVEQRMLAANACGRDYVVVVEVAVEPPWPKYDDFDGTPEELVVKVGELGYSYADALEYERSKWGQQREDVIIALGQATNRQSPAREARTGQVAPDRVAV